MSEQPEALRLAGRLDQWGDQGDLLEAAAELRCLHALCEEMGEALALVVLAHEHKCGMDDQIDNARKVGAKWKESK